MAISLDELIVEHRDWLVDVTVKDAIRQIPSYEQAPLRQTVDRVERFLDAVAESVAQNEPDVLEEYLVGVARARKREGYAIMELHAIVCIGEAHLGALIRRQVRDDVAQNGLLALLEAVMGAARMVLSVRYALYKGES